MKNRPYILVSEKGQSSCGGSVSPEEWEEAPIARIIPAPYRQT